MTSRRPSRTASRWPARRSCARTGVTALALSPGFVRTERVVDVGHADRATESPLYAGRALAALAADPAVAIHAGHVLHAGDLARHYGFTDADGTQPAPFKIGA